MTCPQCGAPVASGKKFCTRCGTAVAVPEERVSSLNIDPESLQKLLAVFAPQVKLEEGQLQMGKLKVDPVRILQPELKLKLEDWPKVAVDQLSLGPQGLSLTLRLT
ncbi:zinc ribbon domain-containing protein [bacterium CPR1]|nr:zinc ribbon domain-containing protein [bacterium CPR1]